MENENVLNQNQSNMLLPVPNATAVLVLGILSIVFCCFIGLVLGIIALVLAGKGIAAYNENPNKYSVASFKNLKAGKVCAIVGLCVSALYTIYWIFYIMIVGAALTTFPWEMLNK